LISRKTRSRPDVFPAISRGFARTSIRSGTGDMPSIEPIYRGRTAFSLRPSETVPLAGSEGANGYSSERRECCQHNVCEHSRAARDCRRARSSGRDLLQGPACSEGILRASSPPWPWAYPRRRSETPQELCTRLTARNVREKTGRVEWGAASIPHPQRATRPQPQPQPRLSCADGLASAPRSIHLWYGLALRLDAPSW